MLRPSNRSWFQMSRWVAGIKIATLFGRKCLFPQGYGMLNRSVSQLPEHIGNLRFGTEIWPSHGFSDVLWPQAGAQRTARRPARRSFTAEMKSIFEEAFCHKNSSKRGNWNTQIISISLQ